MDMRGDVARRESSQVNAFVPRSEKRSAHKLFLVIGPRIDDFYGREVVSIARSHPANEVEAKWRLVVVGVESPE
jgi:hypothetical protein